MMLSLRKRHPIVSLSTFLNVSLSGYYKYRKRVSSKSTKEQREHADKEAIQKICEKYKRKYGYRTITMKLRQAKIVWMNGKSMNHKKVLRLMKKNNLLAKIRRKNPYTHILKATEEHQVKKNVLQRNFWWSTPLQKFGTDITYIWRKKKWSYLSVIRDMVTWEVISHVLSQSLCHIATLRSVEIFNEKLKKQGSQEVLLHSDQWWHYTHPCYQEKLKEGWIIQSMSRKWNCLDNAPTESFFGHMKDEIDIDQCKTFEELEKYIDVYIFEYNNNRPQWSKKKMTPVQYRNHLLKNKN